MQTRATIFQGAQVVDGTGAPAFRADVEVVGDTIATVGDIPPRKDARIIDVTGLTVAPGFIDIHAHSDLTVMVNPACESKIRQGVTLEVNGQCGYSPFPVRPENRTELDALNPFITAQPEWTWTTTGEFLSALDTAGPSTNLAQMVGHTALRAHVVGFGNREATPREIELICAAAEQAIDEGAIGVSFGLAYALGAFAAYDEIEAVARVAARGNAHVSVHIRSEAEFLLEALEEIISVARRVSEEVPLRLQCDHLKASGERWWGKLDEALQIIEGARDEGLDVAFDVYPYTAGSRHFSGSLPAWMHDGGNDALIQRLRDPECRAKLRQMYHAWERYESGDNPFQEDFASIIVMDVMTEANRGTVGKSVAQIAQERGADPIDTAMDLMAEENAQISIVIFSINEDEMKKALAHPLGCIGTDGLVFAPYGPLSSGRPHPRSYGTFPRAVGHYARDQRLMPIEEAVRKCTSLPASRLAIDDRGSVRAGMKADLVVFDPDAIIDKATYDEPAQYPEGIRCVMVNGEIAVDGDTNLGAGAGEVLRRTR